MEKTGKRIVLLIFLALFLALGIYTLLDGTTWFYDNLVLMGTLVVIYLLSDWFLIGKRGFFLVSFGLLVHLFGSFGWYNWHYGILWYDHIVHFIGALATAYVAFNWIAIKMHIRHKHAFKKTVIDEHLIITVFCVLGIVMLLGTFVEVTEYVGFVYLGPGEGLFFVGPGDGGYTDILQQYIDTMEDILVNFFGAMIGCILYYFMRYRKQPWLELEKKKK